MKKSEKKPAAATYAAIARHFGVAESTVAYWKRQGAPIKNGNPNDLAAIARWKEKWERLRGNASQSADASAAELARQNLKAQVRFRTAKAKDAELKLEERQEKLVDREQLVAGFRALIIQWRDLLRNRLPESLVLCLPADMRAKMRVEFQRTIDAILTDLSNPTEEQDDGEATQRAGA